MRERTTRNHTIARRSLTIASRFSQTHHFSYDGALERTNLAMAMVQSVALVDTPS